MATKRKSGAELAASLGLSAAMGAEPEPGAPARRPGSRTAAPAKGVEFPRAEEKKTKRVNLAFRPSEYARWEAAARDAGVSITVFVETVLNDYCSRTR